MPRTRTPDLDAAEPATLIARGEARPAAEPAGATWPSSTPDVDAFVIDPESECLVLAETVGGTAIRPDAPGVRINLLDLSSGDGEDTRPAWGAMAAGHPSHRPRPHQMTTASISSSLGQHQ